MNTIKQLDPAMQLDVENAFRGKLWAYVAVISDHGSALGVATANEPGYSPVPTYFYMADDHTLAEAEANRLNSSRGVTEEAAMDIIITTMGKVQ